MYNDQTTREVRQLRGNHRNRCEYGNQTRHHCDRRVVLWIIQDKFMKDDLESSIASCFTSSKHADRKLR
jgi:hypothetical protein